MRRIWGSYNTDLSVHLVVLVVPVDECHSVAVLLDSTLALSVPVLPSTLGIAQIISEMRKCTPSPFLRIGYFASTALI